MAVPEQVKKSIWNGVTGFVKKHYGQGMARDEKILRGLVAERGAAGAAMKDAKVILRDAEAAPAKAIEESYLAGDAKITAYNAEQSRLRKLTLTSPVLQDEPDLEAMANLAMAQRNATEGAKVLEEVRRLDEAGAARAAELEKVIPGAREALGKANAAFQEAVANARVRQELEGSWFGIRRSQGSKLWDSDKAATPLIPPLTKGEKEPGKLVLKAFNQFSGDGPVPRLASAVVRGTARQVMPFQMEGTVGRWLDLSRSPLTSPGAMGMATTAGGLYVAGGYVGKKTGLISSLSEDIEAANADLEAARKTGDATAVKKAQDRVSDLEKKAKGKAGTPPPTVEQAVVKHTFASIADDYRRTGDAKARDAALSSMGADALKRQLSSVRDRVFSIHNPGQTIAQLSGSDAGRKFVESFDRDTFGGKTAQDWLTTDLDAYQRDIEAKNFGGGY